MDLYNLVWREDESKNIDATGMFGNKKLDSVLDLAVDKVGDYIVFAKVSHVGISVIKLTIQFGGIGEKTIVVTIGKTGVPLKSSLVIY